MYLATLVMSINISEEAGGHAGPYPFFPYNMRKDMAPHSSLIFIALMKLLS